MKRAIVINSMGPLDIAAITLMGLSTKRDDSEKIGMFGTGLKYSLAKLLRDGVDFRIWNGERELAITTRKGDFRGTAYEQVLVDGENTSITTDMGPQWETWWVVRELLSNARDESVHEFFVCDWDAVQFREGWTTIVLDYDHFEQVWLSREKYFVTDRQPKFEAKGFRLLSRWTSTGTRVYKNGVLILESTEEDAWDYDILDAELNEMREPRDPNTIAHTITSGILRKITEERLVLDWMRSTNSILRYRKKPFTGNTGWLFPSLNDTWKKVVAETDCAIHPPRMIGGDLPTDAIILTDDVVKLIHTEQDSTRKLELCDPNSDQRAALARAIGPIVDAGFAITAPVRVCDFGKNILGTAIEGNIVLSPSTFDKLPTLVEVLLEEQMHITTGHDDCTREFQTSIFKAWTAGILGLSAKADKEGAIDNLFN